MDKTEQSTSLDPSIDPKQLVEQSREDAGRISARVDESTTQVVNNSLTATDLVGGLPVIGAEAEQAARNDRNFFPEGVERAAERANMTVEELQKQNYNRVGEEAMVKEVGDRAEALVSDASPELQKQVREAAESSFKAELIAGKEERQRAIDDKAREILAKIQGGAKIEDILPEAPKMPETALNSTDPRDISI